MSEYIVLWFGHEEFSSTLLKGHNGLIYGLASMAEFHLRSLRVPLASYMPRLRIGKSGFLMA